jgi:hypothetical protein
MAKYLLLAVLLGFLSLVFESERMPSVAIGVSISAGLSIVAAAIVEGHRMHR